MTSRGRLHGGRPHARRQRYARGMGLESTKIRCTTLTSITRRASIGFFRVPTFPTLPAFEGRAWEACTVGGVLAAVQWHPAFVRGGRCASRISLFG